MHESGARLQVSALSTPATADGFRLHDLDFELAPGERVAILGPSGAGKSTLLRALCGLERSSGTIAIGGHRIDGLPPHRRGIAYLPQRAALYPQWTVREQLEFAKSKSRKDVSDAIELLNIGSLLHRRPHQLSGGERQRVSLAKLVVQDRPVWLLDEPFSGLDPAFRGDFRHELHLLASRIRPTMLLVTHDPTDAVALGHRIGVLVDGTLQQLGTPEELQTDPRHRFVSFCRGDFSHLTGRISNGRFEADDGSCNVPAAVQSVRPVELVLRAGDIVPRTIDDGEPHLCDWTVLRCDRQPAGALLTLTKRQSRVLVLWRVAEWPEIDSTGHWMVSPGAGFWFDAATGLRLEATP